MKEVSFQYFDERLLGLFQISGVARNITAIVPDNFPHFVDLAGGRWESRGDHGYWSWRFRDGTQLRFHVEDLEPEEAHERFERAKICYRLYRRHEADTLLQKCQDCMEDPNEGEISRVGDIYAGGKGFQRRLLLVGGCRSVLRSVERLSWSGTSLCSCNCVLSDKGVPIRCAVQWINDDRFRIAIDELPQPVSLPLLKPFDFILLEKFFETDTLSELSEELNHSEPSLKSSLARIRRILGVNRSELLIAAWEEWKLYEHIPIN